MARVIAAVTGRPAWQGARNVAGALFGTILFATVMLLITGHDPVLVGHEFVSRTLLRRAGIEESLVAMTPVLIAALSAWIAARAGLWNIGIDGQIIAGALAAGALAPVLDEAPMVVMWIAATAAGMLAGALWTVVPAVLRVRSGINEIVTTIMMTYVAFALVSWLIKGPLQDPSLVSPATRSIAIARRLPHLGPTRVNVGTVLVVLLVVACWAAARWTAPGILSRLVGESPRAARRLGVPVSRYVLGAFLLSGAVAALAGVSQVLAIRGSLQADWQPSFSFAAFAVLFLARQHTLGLIPAAALLGMLSYASTVLPRSTGVAPDFFPMLEGVLLVLLAMEEWRRRAAAKRHKAGELAAGAAR